MHKHPLFNRMIFSRIFSFFLSMSPEKCIKIYPRLFFFSFKYINTSSPIIPTAGNSKRISYRREPPRDRQAERGRNEEQKARCNLQNFIGRTRFAKRTAGSLSLKYRAWTAAVRTERAQWSDPEAPQWLFIRIAFRSCVTSQFITAQPLSMPSLRFIARPLYLS